MGRYWFSILAVCLMTLISTGCISSDDDNGTKEGALAFSLEMVQAMIDGNGDELIGNCADPIYSLLQHQSITKEELSSTNTALEGYPNHTMEDYQDIYNPVLYDYSEYIEEYPELESLYIEGWAPDEDDYLFLGWKLKEGKEGFIPQDSLSFMVTYQSGEFQIIASV